MAKYHRKVDEQQLFLTEGNIDEEDLNQLLKTNQALAQSKKDIHRKKLLTYTQKSIKLGELLKDARDEEQRQYFRGKLQQIEQRQNAEIQKLANIQSIEKEISNFMTEGSEDQDHTTQQRKRSKSSYLFNNCNKATEQNDFNYSINHQAFSKNKFSNTKRNSVHSEHDDMLLDAIEPMTNINSNQLFKRNTADIKNEKILRKQDLETCSGQKNRRSKDKQVKRVPLPQQLCVLVEAISKTLKLNTQNLSMTEYLPLVVKWLRQTQFQVRQLHQTNDNLEKENLSLKRQNKRIDKQKNQKLYELDRINEELSTAKERRMQMDHLIKEERRIMENIDNIEKQSSGMVMLINNALHNIRLVSQKIEQSKSKSKSRKTSIAGLKKGVNEQSKQTIVGNIYSESEYQKDCLAKEFSSFNQFLETYLHEKQMQVIEMQSKALKTEQKLNALIQQQDSLTFKNKQQDKRLKFYEDKIKQMEATVRNLTAQANMTQENINALTQKLNQKQKETNEYQTLIALKKSIAAEHEEKNEKLKYRRKSLTEKIKKYEEESLIQEQKIKGSESKIVEQRAVLQQLRSTISDFERHKQQLQKEIIFKERQCLNKKMQLDRVTTKVSELTKVLDDLKKKHKQQEIILNRTLEEKETLEQMCIDFQKTKCRIQDQYNKISQSISGRQTEIEQLTGQISQKVSKLGEVQSQHIQKQGIIQRLQRQIEEFQKRKKQNNDLVSRQKTEIEEIKRAKSELEDILKQVIVKKQSLMEEMQAKTHELEHQYEQIDTNQILLTDMAQKIEQRQEQLQKYDLFKQEITKLCEQKIEKVKEVSEEIELKIEEEANVAERLCRLKETQKKMMIEMGLKGNQQILDEQLKKRIKDAVSQLSEMSEVKNKLKECKYQNRRLRLDNQRMNKLLNSSIDDQSSIL